MKNLSSLINLAHDKSDESRLELVKLTSQEFLGCKDELSEQQLALFTSIINQLYNYLPNGVKAQLVNALAINAASPENILATIAEDDIEYAGPVLNFSNNLSDDTLIGVIKRKGFDHQVLIAKRPNIGEEITDALAETNNSEIAAEVGKNLTAKISKNTYDKYIQILKDNVDAIGLFAVRSDIPEDLSKQITEIFTKEFKEQSNDNKTEQAQQNEPDDTVYVGEVSVSDCLDQLQNGHNGAFIKCCAAHFGISPYKLKAALDTGNLQHYTLLVRAMDLDVSTVENIRNKYLKDTKHLSQQESKDALVFWITVTVPRAVGMLHNKFDE